MVDYTTDRRGTIHVKRDDEFTFCDREYFYEKSSFDGEDFDVDGGFPGVTTRGPATCETCKRTIDRIRYAVTGVRWNLK